MDFALNIIVIAIVAASTFLWGATNFKGRGAFSAFLALVCVLSAGAIALALWEFVTLEFLAGFASSGSLVENVMWGAGLLVPFVFSLLVLRLLLDLTVRANLKLPSSVDSVGGLAFGACAGIVTAGFVVLSLGMMRTGPALLGYDPISRDGGKVVWSESLWVPVDRVTVAVYEHLSLNAFSTSRPLAQVMPDLHEQVATQRAVPTAGEGGIGRVTIGEDDFEVTGSYTMGGDPNVELKDLVRQPGSDATPELVLPDGDLVDPRSTLWGIAIRFGPGAAEASGQVVVTPSQLRLVVRNPQTGEADGVHPVAFISRTDDDLLSGLGGARFPYARFVVDAAGFRLGSVGGDTTHFFIPEFLVPPGFEPDSLIVKNVRRPVAGLTGTPLEEIVRGEDLELDDPNTILMLTMTGALEELVAGMADSMQQGGRRPGGRPGGMGMGLSFDDEDLNPTLRRAIGIATGDLLAALNVTFAGGTEWLALEEARTRVNPAESGIRVSNRFPGNIGMTANTKGSLVLNEDRMVVSGNDVFSREAIGGNVGRELRVDGFAEGRTTRLVVMQIADQGSLTPIGESVSRSVSSDSIPVLVTDGGEQSQPVGFVYGESANIHIRMTPDSPVTRMADLPEQLTTTRRDQSLWLIYRVSDGTQIVGVLDGVRDPSAESVVPIVAFEPAQEVGRSRSGR